VDFDLSEKHKLLRDRVRQFAAEKVAPVADKFDRTQQFPLDNFRAMGKLGLTGLAIPEEFGGSGADHLAFAIAAEELSRACASTSDILNAHLALCTEPIFMYGNAQQRKKFLPDLVKAEKVGAFGITEADAGSDIASIKSTAVRQGDHYVLNGIKVFITNGDVSDTAVVFANIPELGKRGMTAFIVENGMTGYIKGKKYDKLGMRAGTNCDLVFENCRVPLENRLGEEGQAWPSAFPSWITAGSALPPRGLAWRRLHSIWPHLILGDVNNSAVPSAATRALAGNWPIFIRSLKLPGF